MQWSTVSRVPALHPTACPPRQPSFPVPRLITLASGGRLPGIALWGTCEVVLHNFIRVNTIFEVGSANGLVTAYADKHPSYEFLNGPSAVGLSQ